MSAGFISYLRVSTEKQGESGFGIEAQRTAISQFARHSDASILGEFIEVESGKRNDRPVLQEALRVCRKTKSTLLVAKLDRLSRTVNFLSQLIEAKVDFIAVDNPNANKLMIHVLSAFAEHERDLISDRTRSALSAARARGVTLGNPNLSHARERATAVIKAGALARAKNVLPVISDIQRSGAITMQDIASALNLRGIPTARGGKWYPTSVRNVLRRGSRAQAP